MLFARSEMAPLTLCGEGPGGKGRQKVMGQFMEPKARFNKA